MTLGENIADAGGLKLAYNVSTCLEKLKKYSMNVLVYIKVTPPPSSSSSSSPSSSPSSLSIILDTYVYI